MKHPKNEKWIQERPTWQLVLIILLLLAVEQGLNFTFIDHVLLILDEMIIGGAALGTFKELFRRFTVKKEIEAEEE